MNLPITERQKDLLNIIYKYIKDSGYPPTFEEMRESLGVVSNQSVVDLLNKLEVKGVIKHGESVARGLTILPLGYKLLNAIPLIPLTDTTTAGIAGIPIEPIELQGEWLPLSQDAEMLQGDVFLLKIKGDSMINAGIDNGDLVLVKSEQKFSPGCIVLASINGEYTVKRLMSQNKPPYLCLKPENPSYPIIPLHTGIELKGKIISVIKSSHWKQIV